MGRNRTLDQMIDSVNTVDAVLIKTYFGKVDAELLFQENDDVHGIDRVQSTAEKQGAVVGERFRVIVLSQQLLNELPDLLFVIHGCPLSADTE